MMYSKYRFKDFLIKQYRKNVIVVDKKGRIIGE
jgi:hypothetical protein